MAFIREAECIGCTKCIQACPVDAILGAAKQMHTVIASECTGCDLCVEPCPVDCIDMVPEAAESLTRAGSGNSAGPGQPRGDRLSPPTPRVICPGSGPHEKSLQHFHGGISIRPKTSSSRSVPRHRPWQDCQPELTSSPLSQHIGAPAKPGGGDWRSSVLKGQVIAEASGICQRAQVHAPTSGTVIGHRGTALSPTPPATFRAVPLSSPRDGRRRVRPKSRGTPDFESV